MIGVNQRSVFHECNWKVSVENYSECYHCPVVHKHSTSNVYSGSEYRITIEDGYVRHYSPGLRDRNIHGDLRIWVLWPNFAIQSYPLYRSVSLRQFRSLDSRQTSYDYQLFIDPELAPEHREAVVDMGRSAYHENVGLDDQKIVASVQQGLESRSYQRGMLVIPPVPSVSSEVAVAHFQQRYLDAIGERH